MEMDAAPALIGIIRIGRVIVARNIVRQRPRSVREGTAMVLVAGSRSSCCRRDKRSDAQQQRTEFSGGKWHCDKHLAQITLPRREIYGISTVLI